MSGGEKTRGASLVRPPDSCYLSKKGLQGNVLMSGGMKRPSGEHTPLGTVPTVFESPSVGPPKNPGILFLTYQQINAVLAAFVFIQFLSHFVTFDWRGPLAELAAAWDLYVHPVVQWLFEISLVALVKLIFKFDIIIPPILIDYTSVGLVYYISIIRAKLSRPRIGFRRRDSTRWKRFLVLANPAHVITHALLGPAIRC